MAATGRKVITYGPPRDYTTKPFDHKRLQSQAGWTITKSVLRDADSDQVDFFTHSWGGPIGAGIAVHNREHVRHLILHDSAGLVETNVIRLAPGAVRLGVNVLRQARQELPFELTRENVLSGLRHLFFNPTRTIGEANAAAKSDIRQALRTLHNFGVSTATLHSEHDELFGAKDVSRIAEDLTDYFRVITGVGHAGIVNNPLVVVEAVNDFYAHVATRDNA
jgi:pimeloyl-ACP methyl ester carboxylesterase